LHGPFITVMVDVLLVSYFFPPVGGGAVIRALKLAKYLPEFGYVPTVLAADDERYTNRDPYLLEQIPPDVTVYRLPVRDPFEWPANLYRAFSRAKSERPKERRATAVKESFGARLRRVGSFPDPFFPFYKAALKVFFRITKRYNIKAIISTAPPYTDHIVGYRLARITGLPLVLDYRDAWTYNPFGGPPTFLHAAGWRIMEQKVLSSASAVLTVTDTMADDYRRRFRIDVPVYVVPNGFDEDDFASVVEIPRDRFTVVYAGKFYEGREPYVFLEGVRRAISAGDVGPEDIEIRFLGAIPDDIKTSLLTVGLPVIVKGHVTHREAISEIVSAHANLLVIGEGPGMGTTLTGKLFEYLRAGRPIIALVPPAGEAAKIIREMDAGFVVSPSDVQGAADLLSRLYARYRRGELVRRETLYAGLERYDRRNIAGRFAEILDSLTIK
jgi:glycosyltransferase involved in cell wall biosynthesis